MDAICSGVYLNQEYFLPYAMMIIWDLLLYDYRWVYHIISVLTLSSKRLRLELGVEYSFRYFNQIFHFPLAWLQ